MGKMHKRAYVMTGPGYKTSASMKRGSRAILVSVLTLIIVIIFYSNQKYHPQVVPSEVSPSPTPSSVPTASPEPVDLSQNATLGFGAILIGIMPHRTDQIDAISLLSHFSGLDMTVVPGVDAQSVQDVAMPPGDYRWNGGRPGQIGCWRSHLNMLKQVVDRKLSTALILEADADWDVDVKEQFGKISANMKGRTRDAPYGDDWDSLFVGHCRHISDHRVRDPLAVFRDDTVPPREILKESVQAEFRHHGVDQDGYRMISKLWGPTCMAGYAVTLAGAAKLIYQLGLVGLFGPIDNEVCRLVQSDPSLFSGLVVTPPLFIQFKTGTRKDSDIEEEVQELNEDNIRICNHCVSRSVREELYDRIHPIEPKN